MIENLLYIAEVFLNHLHKSNFTEEQKEQVLDTVRNIVFVLLIELHKEQSKI